MYATQHPSERVRIIDKVREQRAIATLRRAHRVEADRQRAYREHCRRALHEEYEARSQQRDAYLAELRRQDEQRVIKLTLWQLVRRLFA